jgi:hypothetical protein
MAHGAGVHFVNEHLFSCHDFLPCFWVFSRGGGGRHDLSQSKPLKIFFSQAGQ